MTGGDGGANWAGLPLARAHSKSLSRRAQGDALIIAACVDRAELNGAAAAVSRNAILFHVVAKIFHQPPTSAYNRTHISRLLVRVDCALTSIGLLSLELK